ncbi:MAG: tRNA pseudouridine(55) synthase TruB, partial [Proteobacteria bacterium]|nr:tRNA pseudouridine(55) synthase TruB [Pseudomonadota bacterium]
LQALAADVAALDACLLPIEAGLTGLRRVTLDAPQARRLGQGQAVDLHAPVAGEATVAVFDAHGRALGLGTQAADGVLRAQRLFVWAVPESGGR